MARDGGLAGVRPVAEAVSRLGTPQDHALFGYDDRLLPAAEELER